MSQHFDQELDITNKPYPDFGIDLLHCLNTLSKGQILKVTSDNIIDTVERLNELFRYERFLRKHNVMQKIELETSNVHYIKRLI